MEEKLMRTYLKIKDKWQFKKMLELMKELNLKASLEEVI